MKIVYKILFFILTNLNLIIYGEEKVLKLLKDEMIKNFFNQVSEVYYNDLEEVGIRAFVLYYCHYQTELYSFTPSFRQKLLYSTYQELARKVIWKIK
jgi:hypothetical protein